MFRYHVTCTPVDVDETEEYFGVLFHRNGSDQVASNVSVGGCSYVQRRDKCHRCGKSFALHVRAVLVRYV